MNEDEIYPIYTQMHLGYMHMLSELTCYSPWYLQMVVFDVSKRRDVCISPGQNKTIQSQLFGWIIWKIPPLKGKYPKSIFWHRILSMGILIPFCGLGILFLAVSTGPFLTFFFGCPIKCSLVKTERSQRALLWTSGLLPLLSFLPSLQYYVLDVFYWSTLITLINI